MEPLRDLIVFDWVMGLGATNAAAKVLDLPQSSISRRYRAFASQFDIAIERHRRNGLCIRGQSSFYSKLKDVFQQYRLEKRFYRWSWDPSLHSLLGPEFLISDHSRYINLVMDDDFWRRRDDFLEARILDACFEVCCDESIDWLGEIDVGLYVEIPARHPLAANRKCADSTIIRDYALCIRGLSLPQALIDKMQEDGLTLTTEPGARTLEIKPGIPPSPGCIMLPYEFKAGWKLAKTTEQARFNFCLLLEAVAPLNRRKYAALS